MRGGRPNRRRRLASAHRGRARRPARGVPRVAWRHRHLRHHDRVVVAAVPDRRGARPAVRADPDRVQVDRPGASPRVRLRGGHRLLRGPWVGRGQGRDHGQPAGRRAGRAAEGRGTQPAGRPRRPGPEVRRPPDQPDLGPQPRPRGVGRRGDAAARRPARRGRWPGCPARGRPRDRRRRAAADRGAAPVVGWTGRGRHGSAHRPTERDRAQAQGLPGGHGPGVRPRPGGSTGHRGSRDSRAADRRVVTARRATA